MLLLALFFPLVGLLLALFIAWHGHRNALVGRRNVAVGCAVLALINIFVPSLIGPLLI